MFGTTEVEIVQDIATITMHVFVITMDLEAYNNAGICWFQNIGRYEGTKDHLKAQWSIRKSKRSSDIVISKCQIEPSMSHTVSALFANF